MALIPPPHELDEESGLTADEAFEFANLTLRCESGEVAFSNDDMSSALVLVEQLRRRWRVLRRALETT